MNALNIVQRDGQFVADSRDVARMTETRHDNLLAKIDGFVRVLSTDLNFQVSDFFIETAYQDGTGRVLKRYDITRKGCDMVANKMTGEKGVLFTAAYVTKFEEMEKSLATPGLPRELTRLELIEIARESELARLEAEKKNAELEYQMRIQEPKVALYDVAMNANNAQPVGTIAKTLGVGPYKLFAFLRDKRVFFKRGRDNLPYQEYIDRGYFTVRQYPVMHNTTGIENKPQILVTAKGMDFINRLLDRAKAVVAE